MSRTLSLIAAVSLALVVVPGAAAADDRRGGDLFRPGAPGIGDPYFPSDGNGGYDARHYGLDVRYNPDTDVLSGVARMRARATQDLSSFNLDFVGLTVRSVRVDGDRAGFARSGQELTITPRHGLREGRTFTTVVRYDGVPKALEDGSGFLATDDGVLVIGEPHVASSWFPVNDHPSDKASYDFDVTVPAGLQAVANGVLQRQRTHGGWTTWTWHAAEPMASYLATASVGEFDLTSYREEGLRFIDAVDPDLFNPTAPHTGRQFLLSQQADSSYKRLTRTISVPAGGATLSYWVNRDTERNWDFTFVEAHTVGADDWTTLPDANGNTRDDTGNSCPFGGWQAIHPFLAHYQTDNGDGTCTPTGTTGSWNAATGASDGEQQWSVDLSDFAGSDVEVSISYASDEVVQGRGVFVDDIEVSTGEGSTSFEDDGDVMDGWTVPGAPAGSPGNDNDWVVGTAADAPPSVGSVVQGSFNREPEIVRFLASNFGPYPFSASGGIVDDLQGVGLALENQTRPIYARDFFTDARSGDAVVVHELAHQWFGDSLTVARWQHIWLNEGFATYAEWLWAEHEGFASVQDTFDEIYNAIPEDDPFWTLTIGDPGPAQLFDNPIYLRGAMTLQQLRLVIGDDDFFRLLRTWAQTRRGGNVTTDEFIALAERISGQDLGALFDTWLFTDTKPVVPAAAAVARAFASGASSGALAGSVIARQDRMRPGR
jgi:hypothetical protein